MEASTLQAPAGLVRRRIAIGGPLLRLRSDEQLVALFRAGHEEAFRVIHDRYEKRLLAYARQMLPRGQDAEDALQDVFVRAYSGLRSSDRELALRAWLFRVAHNRCIDELRRPHPPAPEVLQLTARAIQDPVAEAEGRESLRRLIADVRRLPEQQRSALLMREMGGMSYAELAATLGTSVPAVKSLLVRARLALAKAAAARDTACSEIREELADAHDRGVRPNATAKRHMHDCAGCRSFRRELRTVDRRLAALAPFGPLALVAKAFGFSGGAGASSGATAGSGVTAGGATAGGGAAAVSGAAGSGGVLASGAIVVGSGHVATLLAAAVATAGGAVAITVPPAQPAHARPAASAQAGLSNGVQAAGTGVADQAANAGGGVASAVGASLVAQTTAKSASQGAQAGGGQHASRTMAPSSAATSSTTPPLIMDSGSSTTPPFTDPASLGATPTSGSGPASTPATSTGSGSTTGTTGSGSQPGGSPGSSTGTTTGTQGSGTQSGSTGSTTGTGGSGSGTSSGTTGSGSGTSGSGSGTSGGSTSTGTSPDTGSGSGTKTSSSGSGTSTSSK